MSILSDYHFKQGLRDITAELRQPPEVGIRLAHVQCTLTRINAKSSATIITAEAVLIPGHYHQQQPVME